MDIIYNRNCLRYTDDTDDDVLHIPDIKALKKLDLKLRNFLSCEPKICTLPGISSSLTL